MQDRAHRHRLAVLSSDALRALAGRVDVRHLWEDLFEPLVREPRVPGTPGHRAAQQVHAASRRRDGRATERPSAHRALRSISWTTSGAWGRTGTSIATHSRRRRRWAR